jgi:hypothetical protein
LGVCAGMAQAVMNAAMANEAAMRFKSLLLEDVNDVM